MAEEYNEKILHYLFAAYNIYMFYMIFYVFHFEQHKLWLIGPVVGIATGLYALHEHRNKYSLSVMIITIMTCSNIILYALMTKQFTEVFTVFCAAACMISFFCMPKMNYIVLIFTTVFVLVEVILLGQWRSFVAEDKTIAIWVRISSIYIVQMILINFIRYQQKIQAQLEEKAKQLEIANQAKSDFLSNMSHEIRTPMNAIAGMVELVLQSSAIPEKERDYLEDVEMAGRDLLSIINDLLDFSKIDSGEFKISEEPYQITSVIHDVTSIVQMMMGESKVDLSIDMNPNIPVTLKGDGTRIKQITMNILGNAAKYTPQGKIVMKVDYRAAQTEKLKAGQKIQLLVSVEDTGIGIPKEKLDDLFEAFAQGDTRGSRSYSGNGLGLAITKKLIELMDGKLEAVSEVGKGSTFSFALEQEIVDAAPCGGMDIVLNKKAGENVKGAKKPDMTSFRAPNVKILIVDDNRVNQKVAEGLLKPYNMQIDTASSGPQAIEMVKSKQYDLILMDYMMPEMDGIDATKIIRAMEEEYYKQLPIVALSANAINGVADMFIEGGMNDFVAKPIEMRVMDAKLKKWLPEDKVLSKAKLVYSR